MTDHRFKQLHMAYKAKCEELNDLYMDAMGTPRGSFLIRMHNVYWDRWTTLINRHYWQA